MAETTTPIISLEKVSVRYRVPTEPIHTFKEYAIRTLQGKISHHDFQALHEVDLQIYSGEVMGVIGVNGAGKSTLMKVIARVLHPYQGKLLVRGRLAPLLDLAAGFHPELTGRENVFLGGAILGFSHRQLSCKIDRIIEFSGLGEFIDAPMRTYSSGMWTRLGFALATDERPDVLLVDEVLAVGDENFQQKCLDRIKEFQHDGTTIVLVSHNMTLISDFTTRTCWLHHGKLMKVGSPEDVVAEYRQGVK